MKSFLLGRTAAIAPALRPHNAPADVGLSAVCPNPPHVDAAGGVTPSVECVKQGGKVTRLIITCGCGSRMEVECLYPDD